jgi:uncharacterized protein (TIGR03435 family)
MRIRQLLHPNAGAAALVPLIAVALVLISLHANLRAQAGGGRPAFEVASIKVNNRGTLGAGPVLLRLQPLPGGGLIAENCPLGVLITSAYGLQPYQIVGGPDWINTERYDIQAKAPVGSDWRQVSGPMLQALLEDRFRLRFHRVTKELPVYNLTVAKGGPKIKHSQEGSCVTFSPDAPVQPIPGPGGKWPTFCGFRGFGVEGFNRKLEMAGVTMTELAKSLSASELQRPVVNQTALDGTFDIRVEWAIPAGSGLLGPADANATTSAAETTGPSIFTAMQEQLGLKLESGKGLTEMLVLDHVEKPSAN